MVKVKSKCSWVLEISKLCLAWQRGGSSVAVGLFVISKSKLWHLTKMEGKKALVDCTVRSKMISSQGFRESWISSILFSLLYAYCNRVCLCPGLSQSSVGRRSRPWQGRGRWSRGAQQAYKHAFLTLNSFSASGPACLFIRYLVNTSNWTR